jgi:hypothetical protein
MMSDAREADRLSHFPQSEGKYSYLLGDDIFVAPIVEDSGAVDLVFPPGR